MLGYEDVSRAPGTDAGPRGTRLKADARAYGDGWLRLARAVAWDTSDLYTNGTIAVELPGDADRDGRLNFDDYTPIDRGLARHLAGWVNGDFNGDGVVDARDYLILDTAYAQAGNPPSPEVLAEREARFGAGYAAELAAAVPEPGAARG